MKHIRVLFFASSTYVSLTISVCFCYRNFPSDESNNWIIRQMCTRTLLRELCSSCRFTAAAILSDTNAEAFASPCVSGCSYNLPPYIGIVVISFDFPV